MKKIGLTGGIGSGKSTAAELIAKAGFPLLDADNITRELWKNPKIVAEIGENFCKAGFLSEPFTPQGVRSVALSSFNDMQVINILEYTLHPYILSAMESWLKKEEAQGAACAFIVIPLLFECGLQYLFDETWHISVEREKRERRLQLSRELSAADINLRFNRQWADWVKEKLATLTISNDGTKEELAAAVASALQRL